MAVYYFGYNSERWIWLNFAEPLFPSDLVNHRSKQIAVIDILNRISEGTKTQLRRDVSYTALCLLGIISVP